MILAQKKRIIIQRTLQKAVAFPLLAFFVCVFTSKSYAAVDTKLPYSNLSTELSLVDSVGIPSSQNGASAIRRVAASVRKKLLKHTFRADEAIAVSFNNPGNDQLQTQVLDATNKPVSVELEQSTANGITTIELIPSNEIQPGKYKIVVTGMDGKMLEQDFSWGVLAINTNKSYYLPNERAHLEFAVLNDNGNMVCDAKLTLQIQNEALGLNETISSENGDIQVNAECFSHDFTLKPDYEATYQVRSVGVYSLTLTAETDKGKYIITDAFEVRESVPFEIERITATRIYPPHTYPVIFKLTANQDFEGTIKEAVPGSFTTSPMTVRHDEITRTTYRDELTQPHPTEKPKDQEEIIQKPETETIEASPSSDLQVATASAYTVDNDPILGELKTAIGLTSISLSMPFEGSYPLTQRFGVQETDPLLLTKYLRFGVVGHDGIDFALPRKTPVLASDYGTVLFADNGDYGTTVVVQHAWGRSYYGHVDEIYVHTGDVVNRGNTLGLSGNTGLSTGPHLHFGIKPNDYNDNNGYFGKIDPMMYLNTSITRAVAGTTTTSQNLEGFTQVTSIEYPLTLKKGESIQLAYKYLAPQKSPESYLLGPLQFVDKQNTVVFEESRQWQIAADALWYNSNWLYRKTITIDHTKVANTNQSNFPVLISLTTDTDLGARARNDGFDILFTSSDGSTKIPADRTTFDGTSGKLIAWVKVPTVSTTTDTVLYMYYGNSGSCDQSLSSCDATYNAQTVWTDYNGVWHLDEDPSGAAPQMQDSTSNNFDLRNWSGVPFNSGDWMTEGNSKIYRSVEFGDNSTANLEMYIANSSDPSGKLYPTGDFTISGWFSSTVAGAAQEIVYKNLLASPWQNYNLYKSSGNEFRFVWCNTSSCATASNNTTFSTSNWYYVTGVRSGTDVLVYVNGSSANSTNTTLTGTTPTTNLSEFLLGAVYDVRQPTRLDDIRLRPSALSEDWLTTEYNNINSPSTFYTVGTQDCYPGNPPGPDFAMRHGKYFSICGRQAFSW